MGDVDRNLRAPAGLPFPHVEGVKHRYAMVDGLRLHYAEAGQGEPLILLHGWPQHWWAWREVIPALADRYRVICPDIRGLGWSEGSADDYGLHRLAADVTGLMDVLGIDRARLAGHDWGVVAGYRACVDWPGRFERFVALGGVHPWGLLGDPRLYLKAWHIFVMASLGPYATTRLGLPESRLRAWRHRGRFSPEEMAAYCGPLRRPGPAHATQRYYRTVVTREIPRAMLTYRGVRLHVPTLHINGENDPLTRHVRLNYQHFCSRDFRFEEIPNCGHFIAEEQPQILTERMLDFLE